MIEVKFTFTDVRAAVAFLHACGNADARQESAAAPVAGEAQVATPPKASAEPVAAAAPKKRGRPVTPKEPAAPAGQLAPATTAAAPTDAAASPAPAPTDSDVRQALQRLCEKHGDKGLQEVSKFIGTFKQPDGKPIQRVSELRPEQYADVIARVAEAVK